MMVLLAVALNSASIGTVSADYKLAELRYCLASATQVVDATITEITKQKVARLDIHQHLKGKNAPPLLTGTSLSCTHEPPEASGVQAGKRYIIIILGPRLYEETTFYEVTSNNGGAVGCPLTAFKKRWLGASDTSVRLDEMVRLVALRRGM